MHIYVIGPLRLSGTSPGKPGNILSVVLLIVTCYIILLLNFY